MKISRQHIQEGRDSIALWLHEFGYDLEKNAQQIDYLKEYLNKNKKKTFNTIEEKLADIRQRVGFDLAVKISNEVEKNQKSASDCGCHSKTNTCSCSTKVASTAENRKRKMGDILKYIKDMVSQENHLDPVTVLNKCKTEEYLGFNELEPFIDKKKLIDYINQLINEKGHNINEESVTYTPNTPLSEFESDDRVADYYNHAEPHS